MALGIYEEEDIRAMADKIRSLSDDPLQGRKYTVKEMSDGIDHVHSNAYSRGLSEGYDDGKINGYAQGHLDGVAEGVEEGKKQGKEEAYAEVDTHIKSAIEKKGVEVADGTPIAEYDSKVDEVYEAGKKSEYDAFWDAYQDNGKPKSYKCAFGGYGWTPEIFRPKHNLIVTNANMMFSTCTRIKGIDLEQHFKELGITFDTSGVAGIDGFDYFCQYASPSVLPVIDTRGTTQIRNFLFHTSDLVTVRKVILKDDGSQKFSNPFPNNSKLENIVFEGVIGQNGVNVQQCTKLTHDSLMSIINALKDFSGTDTWMTVTLGAANIAKLTEQELAIMTNKQWEFG